jgi:hypothetical protein
MSAAATLLITPCDQQIVNTADFSQSIVMPAGIIGSDLQSGGGFICYKSKELISPNGEMSFQALYFTVGQYHCVHRFGLSQRITGAINAPLKSRAVRNA